MFLPLNMYIVSENRERQTDNMIVFKNDIYVKGLQLSVYKESVLFLLKTCCQ